MATILAVFAHPDDETFICGGTLAKAAAEGHDVTLVCATKGEMGRRMGVPATATRESIATVREQELKVACQELGIQGPVFLGYRDKSLEIQPREELVNAVLLQIERMDPDVVLTFHETFGGHPDHCTIGSVTTEAVLRHQTKRPSVKLRFLAWSNIGRSPKQYGLDPNQVIAVDVSGHRREKMKAFRAHRTQTEMNPSLWKSDASGMAEMGATEYFLQAQSPFRRNATSLVDA